MTDAITPKVRSVENMVKRFIEKTKNKGGAILRTCVMVCIALVTSTALTACEAKEPEMVSGLAVQVFNYSQESIAFVKINGQSVGGSADKAKIGDIEGGGGNCCPLTLSPTDKTAEVIVATAKAAGDYKTTAIIEHPWPSGPNTAVIHILPGRKVVIEVGLGEQVGRRDLLEAQIKVLGLKLEVPLSDLMLMRTGPHEYTEYYQPNKTSLDAAQHDAQNCVECLKKAQASGSPFATR